ncbi:MAG: OmpA family protein, partial [Elusimicrobiota bacterium]|jgi:peptidoglycan-associated lipoprotein|nr:OmpA family protein [Elusimicrobiota bacterium]
VFVFIASTVTLFGCAAKEDVNSENDEIAAVPVVEETVVIDENIVDEPAPEPVSFAKVNFDFDKSDLRSDASNILRQNAQLLLNNPNLNVVVEGYCDDRGTIAYNLALGQHRADSVRKYYVDSGVASSRITTISYGKEKPLVEGDTEEARAANRRVETTVR